MVCYNSMSPLPSSASMLCSCFCIVLLLCSALFPSVLNTTSCSTSLLPFMLCVASAFSSLCHGSPLQVMHYVSSYPHASLSKKTHSLLCSACLSHPSSLPDHHHNSSSSLVVILNLFIISGRYPKIPWLLWQSQLFVFSVSYNQSFLASLASKPLPSRDHRW
jgi:hypothetical protein